MADWSDIWTLAERKEGLLHPVSFELLARGRALADARGCRLCSLVLGHEIAQADDVVNAVPLDIGQHGLQCGQVTVNIRKGCYAHGILPPVGRPHVALCRAFIQLARLVYFLVRNTPLGG